MEHISNSKNEFNEMSIKEEFIKIDGELVDIYEFEDVEPITSQELKCLELEQDIIEFIKEIQ